VTVDVGTTSGRSSATEGGVLRRGDGLDISAEERGSVFDPGHTTAEVGTGFGSRVVEAVAEAHGWEVAVTESAPRRGSGEEGRPVRTYRRRIRVTPVGRGRRARTD
jgi:nitrogen fixation/metabolism regulation signal transduction histidine kinase